MLLWAVPSVALAAAAAEAAPQRPRIVGVSHVVLRVSDVEHSRAFYEGLLGLEFSGAGAGPWTVAVSERQHVELRAGLKPDQDRLEAIAFATDDVPAMRRYLSALPAKDPEGRLLDFVVAPPGGAPRGDRALSRRILHVGTLVGDLPAANRFYSGLLGFQEIWRGSRSGTELSWTNMKVPEGDDYVEFMLYAQLPAPDARGTQHHICLQVDDIEKAKATLHARVSASGYARPLEVRVGTNRKRQLNLYDPDGTRVELMEPVTVDGQPAPSSTAPPPQRSR